MSTKEKFILLIMPYGSVGGMERLALSFYSYYKSINYTVKVVKFIQLKNDIINFGSDELFLSSQDFSSMSKKERFLFYFKAPFQIKKIVQDYKITHSVAFGDMANLFSSVSFSHEYKIGSIHALKSVELNQFSFFNFITKIGYKTTYKNLDKLVCISKDIKEDLLNNCGYRFQNIEIIYNPHDIKKISKMSKESILEKKEIDIFSKKTILFLGRLSIQKAPWHLIKAFSIVLKSLPDTNLVFIGDGNTLVTNYVIKIVKKLHLGDNVFFLGRKSNPYKYIASANLLALSSHYEGTPNVIVESIAIGTPIVSSFCTKGIIELMSENEYYQTSENIELESGIVTPNLYKGVLGVPHSNKISAEEEKLSNALIKVLNTNFYKKKLLESQFKLLSKFDLELVLNKYLKNDKNEVVPD